MDTIPLKPERRAQLEWERQDFTEAKEGIRRGYEDVKAGRTRPASEFLADLRRKL